MGGHGPESATATPILFFQGKQRAGVLAKMEKEYKLRSGAIAGDTGMPVGHMPRLLE